MLIEEKELAEFLTKANKQTYANTEAPKAMSLRPDSHDYHFIEGDLVYHDTYFGARDFIGEEVVYKAGVVVWAMNYYGFVLSSEVSTKDAYKVLRPALKAEYDDLLPVRGPAYFVEERSEYRNVVEGTLERFTGEEEIFIDGKLVARCHYHGGGISD